MTYRPYTKSVFFLLFAFVFAPLLTRGNTTDFIFGILGMLMFFGGSALGFSTRITFHKEHFDTTIVPKAILVDCTNIDQTKQNFQYSDISKIEYQDIEKRFAFRRFATVIMRNGDKYVFPIHLFTFSQGLKIKNHLDSIK